MHGWESKDYILEHPISSSTKFQVPSSVSSSEFHSKLREWNLKRKLELRTWNSDLELGTWNLAELEIGFPLYIVKLQQMQKCKKREINWQRA